MERHANYALVGAVSIILLSAALIFVVWLGGTRFGQTNDDYRVIFHGPVRGLSVGGEVQFNGIKMGQIQRITLDENDPNRVLTDIEIAHKTPVRIDSVASTETQGIGREHCPDQRRDAKQGTVAQGQPGQASGYSQQAQCDVGAASGGRPDGGERNIRAATGQQGPFRR